MKGNQQQTRYAAKRLHPGGLQGIDPRRLGCGGGRMAGWPGRNAGRRYRSRHRAWLRLSSARASTVRPPRAMQEIARLLGYIFSQGCCGEIKKYRQRGRLWQRCGHEMATNGSRDLPPGYQARGRVSPSRDVRSRRWRNLWYPAPTTGLCEVPTWEAAGGRAQGLTTEARKTRSLHENHPYLRENDDWHLASSDYDRRSKIPA